MLNFYGLGTVLAVGGFLLFFLFIVGIALYLLFAFGLYKLAENQKVEYSWLAFIPIAQLYVMGKLVKEIKIFNYIIPSHELVLPIAPIVYLIVSKIPVIGFLLWLATAVLTIAAMYYLFKRYKGESAVMLTVISCVLFFMGPIFVFNMRDAKPLD